MLLVVRFDDAAVNSTLEVFLEKLEGLFASRLLSVMVYGSLVHGDLAPGYGDLDFIVIVDGDLGAAEQSALAEMRVPLRSGMYGMLASMLEGAFLTPEMLRLDATGSGFWWGTTRERPIQRNPIGWLNSLDLKENGVVIFGADLRSLIPIPTRQDILNEIAGAARMIRRESKDAGRYAVDWLLQIARFLVVISEGPLVSKTEGALWAAKHAKGSWRHCLVDCSMYRKDATYRSRPGADEWLASLGSSLEEACDELESALFGGNQGSW